MKRIIYLILGVWLFIPFLVMADDAAPVIRSYKATPKDSNGAYIYVMDDENYIKTERKLEYGKVITITLEDEYVPVNENDEDNDDYVKLSDLVTIEKDYKIDKKHLFDPKDELAIKELKIKKGPGLAYESTNVAIPAGTKIKVREFKYYDSKLKKYILDESGWKYIEYNGTKGFVYTDTDDRTAIGGTYTTILCYQETKVFNVEYTKIIAIIKPNTKFNAMVYDTNSGYYIEYGNIKGIISSNTLVKASQITFKPKSDINLYDKIEYDNNGNFVSKPIDTISKDKTYTSNYYNVGEIIIYYENGGTKGWIRVSDSDYDDAVLDSKYNADKDGSYPLYDLGITFAKDYKILTVEKGKDDANNTAVTILNPPQDVPKEGEKIPDNPTPGGSSIASDQPKTETKTKKIPGLVYYCLGAAVVVSLTAVVTILLVNKKKKKTEEPKTDDITPVEEKK